MKNKNLLVTGGATRVGKAIALHFAERGWNIALHYFRSSSKATKLKKILEENLIKVALIKADLKNPKQAEKVIPLAKKKLGAIDCLINNAALFEKDDITNFTTKSWDDHLKINLLAPAILIKHFAKQAPNKNVSNIINIIDQRIFNLTPFFMSYTISKSGLQTLTKTMAMRLGPKIKVNAIAPGPFPTKGAWSRILPGDISEKLNVEQQVPLRRAGDHQELANLAAYLVSDFAVYMNGEVVIIDGGEWLQGAGQMNFLEEVPSEMWDWIEKATRGSKE